jgi:hypothetical protein
VAVHVASATATASATGPLVGPMVGASAVAAAAARVAVRDDLTIAASSCCAVANLRGSAGVGTSTVGLSRQLGSSTVTVEVHAATCSFVVAVPGGGRLGDPVVDSQEVSVFCECRMNLPGPTTSVGTRTDYSVGPWDYPACAARHQMA